MKVHCLVLLSWLLMAGCIHTLHAADGVEEAKQFLAPYSRFCSALAFALEHSDGHKLVELTEPAFRIVLTNDISRFRLRFEEIRKSRVYCDVRDRREVYEVGLNSAIDRCIGGEIADLVPINVICLKASGSDTPTFDRLYVNTVLHTNGCIGIIGRFILGPYISSEQVVSDFSALNNVYLDKGTEIYRTSRMSISASESAWRLARKFKAMLSRGESIESFRTKVSPNAVEADVISELSGLSAYSISEIVPFGSDSQYMWNTVDARDGDVSAYVLAIHAEESPAREVGRIGVIVSSDSDFRITYAFDEGRLVGVEPHRSRMRDNDRIDRGQR